MKANKAFIKGINWLLAAIISMLGFAGCDIIGTDEYGSPRADYTVKGAVVNKATGKPIKGIRVGYSPEHWAVAEYGIPPTPYTPKPYVLTDTKGEFKLTDSSFPKENLTAYVFVEDIDGEENGLFQSESIEVDFSKATQSGKPKSWYNGEYTVNVNVELTEIKNQ